MVEIRLATPADAPRLHQLMLSAFTPFVDQYTPGCFDATVLDPPRIVARMEQGPIWIAGDMDATMGAVIDDRGLYVRGMAVDPGAQRRGLGRQLLEAAQAYAKERDLPCVWLSTTTFLRASQALYEAFGFVPSHGPPDLEGTPLVSYEKLISSP